MKRTGDILLKTYAVSEEVFNNILAAGYSIKIITDDDEFYNYKFGYDEKTVIAYDGFKCMIMLECILNEHYPLKTRPTYWKQVIVRKELSDEVVNDENTIDAVRGSDAYNYIRGVILQHYTADEYTARLKMFEADYNADLAQYHFMLFDKPKKVIRYDNCYKWDINGAHNDALCEIFPKAAPAIRTIYNMRKQHPEFKIYINYYCGMLPHRNHRKTYNWIVQRTTNLLLKGIELADGDLLYANTDGFIVQNPKHIIPNSTTLGEYKLEYSGPVWTYFDNNYQCFQLETGEIKGSVLHEVRHLIDLPNNQVVHYDREHIGPQKGGSYRAINIATEVLANGR
jgi:hypothetical protein